LQHEAAVIAVAFSPDGGAVVTGSVANTARLWDAGSGKPISPPLQHGAAVVAVAFSPDGQFVVTGSGDNTARLWDAGSGKPISSRLLHQDSIFDVAFRPDGKRFFVATDHWLSTYSWDGKNAVLQNSQLIRGVWKKAFRFPSDCQNCLQVVLGETGNSLKIETLRLDEPSDPPIQGDPQKLLKKWQERLGLRFDEKMDLVPR
jgi:WD40 repeat protein